VLLDGPGRVGPEPDGGTAHHRGRHHEDVVHLQAGHGDALDDRGAVQVHHHDLGPVVVVLAVGVAADQRPAAGEREAPGEAVDRHPPHQLAVGVEDREAAGARLAHEPLVAATAGGVGVGQAGEHVPPGPQVVDEAGGLALVDLPALVALPAAEGADVEGAVHHHQRVDVPGIRGLGAPPHQAGLVGPRIDAPDGVVPAGADVRRALEPHHVVGVPDGVEAPVGPHAAGVVGQQLTGRGLLARRPQQPPQPPAAQRQARAGQVVEGDRHRAGGVVEPASPLAEPADQHVGVPERAAPGVVRARHHSMPCSRA